MARPRDTMGLARAISANAVLVTDVTATLSSLPGRFDATTERRFSAGETFLVRLAGHVFHIEVLKDFSMDGAHEIRPLDKSQAAAMRRLVRWLERERNLAAVSRILLPPAMGGIVLLWGLSGSGWDQGLTVALAFLGLSSLVGRIQNGLTERAMSAARLALGLDKGKVCAECGAVESKDVPT